jgi:translation initiation factor 1
VSGTRRRPGEGDRLVYATGRGRVGAEGPRGKAAAPGDGVVRVGRAVQGRRGKAVTTITGLPLDAAGLRALAGELKRRLGCGGSVASGVIEIQGEHRDALVTELEARGYRVKRSGG